MNTISLIFWLFAEFTSFVALGWSSLFMGFNVGWQGAKPYILLGWLIFIPLSIMLSVLSIKNLRKKINSINIIVILFSVILAIASCWLAYQTLLWMD